MGHLTHKLSKYPEINLIVLADHGQMNIDKNRIYYLSDYVNKDMLAHTPFCSSYCFLQPATVYTSQQVIEKLSLLKKTGGFRIFKLV